MAISGTIQEVIIILPTAGISRVLIVIVVVAVLSVHLRGTLRKRWITQKDSRVSPSPRNNAVRC